VAIGKVYVTPVGVPAVVTTPKAYVKPVRVPAVVVIAASAVVVSVNPVTEGLVPVIAETLYVVGLLYPVMLPVPPSVPAIVRRSPIAT
jgi:hypothetical protein